MLEFTIKTIIADETGEYGSHTIFLTDKLDEIIIPIRVDQNAVNSILLAKENKIQPRPDMHNTTIRIIKALKAKVEKIIISKYENEIFYTYIRMKNNDETIDIDVKPSDAFSISLRCKAPIFIAQSVIEETGLKLDSPMFQNTY